MAVYGCLIGGCEMPHVAKGYCNRHYERLRLNGDPLRLRPKGPSPTPAIRRFLDSIVVVPETGCWEWTGHRQPSGYGGFFPGVGHSVGAHRWSYERFAGPIPSGLQIDHLCRNRPCVNPDHLEPVTCAENIRRGETGKWQSAKTHCAHGHEYTPRNTVRTRKGRACRECRRIQAKAYYAANKQRWGVKS